MSHPPPTQKSSKPWGASNPIPNIQEFVGRLDKDKAARDKAIDAQNGQAAGNTQVTAHQNQAPQAQGKTVTDPVTGKQVVIADVGKEYMKNVDNPMV